MNADPCKFDECIDLIHQRSDLGWSPGVWAIIIGVIITIVWVVLMVVVVRSEAADKPEQEQRADYLEATAFYIGLGLNLVLFIYLGMVYWRGAKSQYYLVKGESPKFTPLKVGFLFLGFSLISLLFVYFSQQQRLDETKRWSVTYYIVAVVIIVILAILIAVLSYIIISLKATPSARQLQAIKSAGVELTEASKLSKQFLENEKKKAAIELQKAKLLEKEAEDKITKAKNALEDLDSGGTSEESLSRAFITNPKFAQTIQASREKSKQPAAPAQPTKNPQTTADDIAALLASLAQQSKQKKT